jgi:hypothetical protein
MTNVQKTMNVNPAGWEWHGKTYDHIDKSETVIFGTREASLVKLYLAPVVLVAAVLIWWNYGARVEFSPWTIASLTLSTICATAFFWKLELEDESLGELSSWAVTVLSGIATVALFLFQWDKNNVLMPSVLGSVLCVFALNYLIVKGTPRKGAVINKYREGTGNPLKCFIYGTPGSVGDATDVFDAGNLEAGVRGEKNTAELLQLVSEIPGTNVFHGLRFPGSANADVDHAVVNGNNVFLIDSKQYRPGVYQWDFDGSDDIITGDGRTLQNHMASAADGYEAILGHGVNVIPIVMIHGNGVIVGAYPSVSKGVHLMTADEAIRFIGNTIDENLDLSKHNGRIIDALLDNMK